MSQKELQKARCAFAADDTYADQAELSDKMMGEKIERPTVQGQHYDSMGNTHLQSAWVCMMCLATLLAVGLCVCWCTCASHSECLPTSLFASMCTAPHVEPATHAFEPRAVADSLLVCVVEEVEKEKKMRKRKMLQKLEQQEAVLVFLPLQLICKVWPCLSVSVAGPITKTPAGVLASCLSINILHCVVKQNRSRRHSVERFKNGAADYQATDTPAVLDPCH